MSRNCPQTVTLNIPFKARLEATAEYMAFIDHPAVTGCVHAEASKAKGKLKAMLTAQIEDGLLTVKNSKQSMLLGCADGTVMFVAYRCGNWGYQFGGPNYKYAGSSAGAKDFAAAVAQAREHANQSYGGVVWESIL